MSMIEKMKAYLATPEGKAATEKYFANIAQQEAIKEGRFKKFDEWVKTNDFDKLLYLLILQHDDDYKEKCYHKGYEPYQPIPKAIEDMLDVGKFMGIKEK